MSEKYRTVYAAWAPRIAAVIAASVALSVTSVSPAHAADTEGPIVVSASVSRETIDVVDGPVKVTVRLEVKDLVSGVASGFPTLDPSTMFGGVDPIPNQTMVLVAGNKFQGTYETTFTFPEFISSGQWTFSLRLKDVAGNYWVPADGAFDDINIYPTVVSMEDTTAPKVTTSNSATIVDVTDGPAEVVTVANVYDDGVGIPADAQVMVTHRKGSSSTGWYVRNSSTDPHRAKFSATMSYPQYTSTSDPRGTYTYDWRQFSDGNGNATSYWNSAGGVTVATRPLRSKRPDLRRSEAALTATWTAHSDILGILEYETEFSGPNYVRTIKTTSTVASLSGMPGGSYTSRVRARNQLGWGEWTTASAPIDYTLMPMVGATPLISGTAQVGQSLTAESGTWTPGATLTYRWLANGVAIPGASGSTYELTSAQVGQSITVRITGSKPGFTTDAKRSAATAAVSKGTLMGAVPTIAGTARVGAILTASPGSWTRTPVNVTYQWYRSGVAIASATAPTYSVVTEDLGNTITVKTTGRKTGYNVLSKTSRPTIAVVTNLLTAPRPRITGTTSTVGSTLKVNAGTWSPSGVTLTYQWQRNGSSIPGATTASYKIVAADRGTNLTVRVTGRKGGYVAKATTSAAWAAR